MHPLFADAVTTVEILQIAREPVWLIQCDTPIPAGFPYPAEDEAGELVDLNKILLPYPLHTFLARLSSFTGWAKSGTRALSSSTTALVA